MENLLEPKKFKSIDLIVLSKCPWLNPIETDIDKEGKMSFFSLANIISGEDEEILRRIEETYAIIENANQGRTVHVIVNGQRYSATMTEIIWSRMYVIAYYFYHEHPIWKDLGLFDKMFDMLSNGSISKAVKECVAVIDRRYNEDKAFQLRLASHSSILPTKQEKTEYFFSYEKVRQKLRITRRVSRHNKFPELTTLDELCYMFNFEQVGYDAYGEVEWRAFNITTDKLDKMAFIIEKPDEIVRVFTYLSDHAADVLPLTAVQDEIEKFELECDRIVNKTIQDNPSPIMGGYDENKPYLGMIARNMAKPYGEWSKRDKIIFEHMDKRSDYAYTNLFPFEALYFAATSSLGLMVNLIDTGEIKEPSIQAILPNLRAAISMFSYRPVRQHSEPIEQALYVLSILAREKAQIETDLYDEISLEAIDYVREKYAKDIESNVLEAMYDLAEYKRTNPEPEPQEEPVPFVRIQESTDSPKPKKQKEPKKVKNQDEQPNSSFFAISDTMTYETCAKELLRIINSNKWKSDICRQLTSAASSLYFNFGDKTDDEKARAINPWVKKAGKDLVFTGEDFRKARRVKKRKHS